MVNQAGRPIPSHIRRESVVDVVLAIYLQFIGFKTVFGIEVLKQDQ